MPFDVQHLRWGHDPAAFDLAAVYLAPAYFACGNAGMSQHGCAAIELWIDGNEAVVYGQGGAVGIGRAAGRGELNRSWRGLSHCHWGEREASAAEELSG